ncbi:MAG: hypothetical protein FWH51_04250 [Dehalococcoidia bacterium]|nr:hypothetical protein [Dehalococcoidia bacterium]
MSEYAVAELEDARDAIQSSIRKIEKALDTLLKRTPQPQPQITLAKRNLRALRLSLSLIERELQGIS